MSEDRQSQALLEQILAEVSQKKEYNDNTVKDLLDHLIAESNKHPRGSIAMHGQVLLYLPIRANIDKLVFGVLSNNTLHPIFNVDIKKPVEMGRYRLGLFLLPENKEG